LLTPASWLVVVTPSAVNQEGVPGAQAAPLSALTLACAQSDPGAEESAASTPNSTMATLGTVGVNADVGQTLTLVPTSAPMEHFVARTWFANAVLSKPSSWSAFSLATFVVDDTANGGAAGFVLNFTAGPLPVFFSVADLVSLLILPSRNGRPFAEYAAMLAPPTSTPAARRTAMVRW
jgi:hypothetical protein